MSKIEWTDITWNPITGCTPCSPGCKNCWAKNFAPRLAGRFGYPEAPHQFDVTLHHDRINVPLKLKKPRKIFVCSMSDLFHKDVPFELVDKVFLTMTACSMHTFQILTKRASRMKEYFESRQYYASEQYARHPLKNIWLGVSAENQAMADKRIPILLSIPAAVRFVSVEPMLEEIDIAQAQYDCGYFGDRFDIDWIVCGCESGTGRRPFDIEWARSLKNQCVDADVPFFFKQSQANGKIVKMPELDGQAWAQFPEVAE